MGTTRRRRCSAPATARQGNAGGRAAGDEEDPGLPFVGRPDGCSIARSRRRE